MEKDIRGEKVNDGSTSSVSVQETGTQVTNFVEKVIDLQQIARQKGYEEIRPLGVWYLGEKLHGYKGEDTTGYYYTYDLLGKDMEKLRKMSLPNGITLHSPGYGGVNNDRIIITHGILSPLIKKYALFDTKGTRIPLIDTDGRPQNEMRRIDFRDSKVVLIRGMKIESIGNEGTEFISDIGDDGVVSREIKQRAICLL